MRSLKFRNIHRKTPVLESVFNNVRGLKDRNFIKKRLQQVFSCECCEMLKNTYFEEYLQTAAFVTYTRYLNFSEFHESQVF